jgi:uncharacterized protein YkwD
MRGRSYRQHRRIDRQRRRIDRQRRRIDRQRRRIDRQSRILIWYGIAAAVVAVVCLSLARPFAGSSPVASGAADTAKVAGSGCGHPAGQTCSGRAAPLSSARAPAPRKSATPRRTEPAHRPAVHHLKPRPRPTQTAPPQASPSPSPSVSPSPAASPRPRHSLAARRVLAVINQARAQAGLPAYTLTRGLDRSAAAHNARMAGGCGLSHQCPGEASLGARETAAGVHWTSAGENIGEGGPVADSSTAIAQMAATLTRDMINEKPPDDGHRLNILSATFHHVGIAVYRDSSGTVWMTQDFSN